MKTRYTLSIIALIGLFSLSLNAEEEAKKNAYHLTFKDDDGLALAEAFIVTPEFTDKVHPPLKVTAEIRLLDNQSKTEAAGWLKRLLKTGDEVKIEIRTTSYKSAGGESFSNTVIEFNPNTYDANISAQYSHPPLPNERSWTYGIYSGGFEGGSVTFDRVMKKSNNKGCCGG